MGRRIVVPLRPGSDGDPTHRPTSHIFSLVDPPTLYLEKLGTLWIKDRKADQPGVSYVLERLPLGYAVYERPRPQNPDHVDKFLYGHPSRRCFNSPNNFFPHFLHLMNNGGDSMGCICKVCVPRSGESTSSSSRVSSIVQTYRPPTPKVPVNPVPPPATKYRGGAVTRVSIRSIDEEGTPDIYRNLITKLKRSGTLDEPIEEPMSMDWRAEQELLPDLLQRLAMDDQWVPRTGDIVLYIRNLNTNVDICRHHSAEYRLYDKNSKSWLGFPPWEAGLVGQVPAEAMGISDIVAEIGKEMSVTYSGLRVEPLPNPNSEDKSLSKRYVYVPMHQTRPFILWRELLHNTPQANWHPTIINALTLTATVSLLGKYRFKGAWPDAEIFCHGLFMGSEMLAVGDTVRLLPKDETVCADVLVIKSIRLKLSNLDLASSNDYDEGRPYNSEIRICGIAYTSDEFRSSEEWQSPLNDCSPKAGVDYPRWHPLHAIEKQMVVPFNRIMGRLYEHDAMALWLNTDMTNMPKLDPGREGLLEGREFARHTDRRIVDLVSGEWFWGDSRAEALDLQTINGLEVSKWDVDRDPKEWRRKIKHLDDMQPPKAESKVVAAKPRLDLRSFMAPGTTTASLPVRNQAMRYSRGAGPVARVSGRAPDRSRNISISSNAGRKPKPKIITVPSDNDDDSEEDEDEDEDEQAQKVDYEAFQTRKHRHSNVFREDDSASGSERKKARVMVVVDQ